LQKEKICNAKDISMGGENQGVVTLHSNYSIPFYSL
jgi:hypothetical protein